MGRRRVAAGPLASETLDLCFTSGLRSAQQCRVSFWAARLVWFGKQFSTNSNFVSAVGSPLTTLGPRLCVTELRNRLVCALAVSRRSRPSFLCHGFVPFFLLFLPDVSALPARLTETQ